MNEHSSNISKAGAAAAVLSPSRVVPYRLQVFWSSSKAFTFGGGAFAFKGMGLRATARVWVIGAHGSWELLR